MMVAALFGKHNENIKYYQPPHIFSLSKQQKYIFVFLVQLLLSAICIKLYITEAVTFNHYYNQH